MKNKEKIKTQLDEIKGAMKDIDEFTDQDIHLINQYLISINSLVAKNKVVMDKYLAYKKSPNAKLAKRFDMALDYYSENFVIFNQKTTLYDLYIKDIYTRIGKIGKTVTQLSQTVQLLSTQVEAQSNGSQRDG